MRVKRLKREIEDLKYSIRRLKSQLNVQEQVIRRKDLLIQDTDIYGNNYIDKNRYYSTRIVQLEAESNTLMDEIISLKAKTTKRALSQLEFDYINQINAIDSLRTTTEAMDDEIANQEFAIQSYLQSHQHLKYLERKEKSKKLKSEMKRELGINRIYKAVYQNAKNGIFDTVEPDINFCDEIKEMNDELNELREYKQHLIDKYNQQKGDHQRELDRVNLWHNRQANSIWLNSRWKDDSFYEMTPFDRLMQTQTIRISDDLPKNPRNNYLSHTMQPQSNSKSQLQGEISNGHSCSPNEEIRDNTSDSAKSQSSLDNLTLSENSSQNNVPEKIDTKQISSPRPPSTKSSVKSPRSIRSNAETDTGLYEFSIVSTSKESETKRKEENTLEQSLKEDIQNSVQSSVSLTNTSTRSKTKKRGENLSSDFDSYALSTSNELSQTSELSTAKNKEEKELEQNLNEEKFKSMNSSATSGNERNRSIKVERKGPNSSASVSISNKFKSSEFLTDSDNKSKKSIKVEKVRHLSSSSSNTRNVSESSRQSTIKNKEEDELNKSLKEEKMALLSTSSSNKFSSFDLSNESETKDKEENKLRRSIKIEKTKHSSSLSSSNSSRLESLDLSSELQIKNQEENKLKKSIRIEKTRNSSSLLSSSISESSRQSTIKNKEENELEKSIREENTKQLQSPDSPKILFSSSSRRKNSSETSRQSEIKNNEENELERSLKEEKLRKPSMFYSSSSSVSIKALNSSSSTNLTTKKKSANETSNESEIKNKEENKLERSLKEEKRQNQLSSSLSSNESLGTLLSNYSSNSEEMKIKNKEENKIERSLKKEEKLIQSSNSSDSIKLVLLSDDENENENENAALIVSKVTSSSFASSSSLYSNESDIKMKEEIQLERGKKEEKSTKNDSSTSISSIKADQISSISNVSQESFIKKEEEENLRKQRKEEVAKPLLETLKDNNLMSSSLKRSTGMKTKIRSSNLNVDDSFNSSIRSLSSSLSNVSQESFIKKEEENNLKKQRKEEESKPLLETLKDNNLMSSSSKQSSKTKTKVQSPKRKDNNILDSSIKSLSSSLNNADQLSSLSNASQESFIKKEEENNLKKQKKEEKSNQLLETLKDNNFNSSSSINKNQEGTKTSKEMKSPRSKQNEPLSSSFKSLSSNYNTAEQIMSFSNISQESLIKKKEEENKTNQLSSSTQQSLLDSNLPSENIMSDSSKISTISKSKQKEIEAKQNQNDETPKSSKQKQNEALSASFASVSSNFNTADQITNFSNLSKEQKSKQLSPESLPHSLLDPVQTENEKINDTLNSSIKSLSSNFNTAAQITSFSNISQESLIKKKEEEENKLNSQNQNEEEQKSTHQSLNEPILPTIDENENENDLLNSLSYSLSNVSQESSIKKEEENNLDNEKKKN